MNKYSTEKQVKKLLVKYEKKLDKLIVMDDYDGGQRSILDLVVDDLKTLDKYIEMEKYPHQDNHMD
jgi:flagellar biosynthesis/type III secretory pathway ATPase